MPRRSAAESAAKPKICIFSKHMAQFDWKELGRKAKEIGFEGVDLTVRPKGHVLPERVKDDLPRAVDAIRAAGLDVPMITTDLKSAADPAAIPTFETARKLGIRFLKPGYWTYSKERTVLQTQVEVRQNFQGLLKLALQHGITLGLHNHSGAYVGTALWAYRDLLQDVDPRWAGYYFDPGHATIEGGLYVWRISLELVLPRLKMVAMKDAYWEKVNGKWRPKWVPLGEGMVDWPEVFRSFAKGGFSGPLSLHVEYTSNHKDELEAIVHDVAFMKKQVALAYGA
jgi:sugar phosphate isomerase/epimerase